MDPIVALILFALITMTAIVIEVFYTYGTQGIGFGFSSNRPLVEKTPFGLRIERAYRNQIEASAYIVPVLAAAAFVGLESEAVRITCAVIVLGRAAFIPLYYTGIPFIRILGFSAASFGTLYLIYLLLTSPAVAL